MNGTILAPVLCMRFNAKATISTGGLLSAINEHIKKIYADGKLTEAATIRKLLSIPREIAQHDRSN